MKSNISILSLLGLLFVGLKLTEVIAWSWWLVLLPFYLGFALLLLMVATASLAWLIIYIAKQLDKMRRK